MSGGADNGGNGKRQYLTGEFNNAFENRFEVEMERNFELTVQDEVAMDTEYNFKLNNLEQKWKADKANLAPGATLVPEYDLVHRSPRDVLDQYNDISTKYHQDKFEMEQAQEYLRQEIRDTGAPLMDVFDAEIVPRVDEFAEKVEVLDTLLDVSASQYVEIDTFSDEQVTYETDLSQLGIDTQYEFNSSADIDYYGHDSSNDFIAPAHDHDNGRDGDHSR